mgnify:FL=1
MEEIKEEQAEKAIEKNKELVKETVFKSADDDSVMKVDLSKPPKPKEEIKNETEEKTKVAEDNTDNERVAPVDADTAPTEEQKEVQPEVETQETPVLEEVTEEEVKEQTEELAEEIIEAKETGKALPENLQKVVDFMEETGGTLEEYVSLNKDYSKEDDSDILQEYYTKTKPHLTTEEINFLLEDNYSYDEDVDDEKDIKRKKLALKEQVADAKNHLDGLKSKYYEEVKSGSKLTKEQQDAISFFDRYKNESQENEKVTQQQTKTFLNKTEQVFNDKFKGFEYEVGEKKFRFNVNNTNDVKSAQSDLNNFVGKFLDKNNNMSDAKGYHKSLFTAMNADVIANHFYEQGKADAIKDTVAKSKNINTSRQSHDSSTESGGIKFKVLGNNSSDYKFKIKNK